MRTDKELLRLYRIKRLQRAIEYVLLFSLFFFFLVAFHGYYRIYVVLILAFIFFGLNLQLTYQRERRRASGQKNRKRIIGDMTESILFLLLIFLMSFPTLFGALFGSTPQEHYALVASVLCGIFLGGLVGEMSFQLRSLRFLEYEEQKNYMFNLKRTIILPYFRTRTGHNS